MLVRGTELWYGVELGMEAFIAPTDFDANAQELNIYSVFSRFYQANSDAAYGFSFTSAISTLSLGVVANRTYIWGETLGDGTEYVSGQVASATAFTTGTTKRFVIVFDSTSSDTLTVTAPSGAVWLYIRKGSVIGIMNNAYIKYIHFNRLNDLKSITGSAFLGATNLSGNVNFPTASTFTTIPQNLFYNCTSLTGSIIIPDNVTTFIQNVYGQFQGCTNMSGILYLSKNVTSVPYYFMFGLTKFTGDLVIPDSVLTIVQSAFQGCRFTSITIGSSVSQIGISAFAGWTQTIMADLIIPISVTTLNGQSFSGSTGFKGGLTIMNPDILFTNASYGPFYNTTGFTSLNLPFGYRNAGNNTFGRTYNFSNNFSAASLNQSILNLPDNFGSFIIGATNKTRLTSAFPSAVTNAAARGITIT